MNVPPILERAREIIDPAMRKAVATLDPLLRTPAEYHMGWVDHDGTPVAGGSGKCIRPALAVLGAEAVDGEADQAIPAAVAVELIHNFSLIHDDIMDGDRTRRHRPTVWDVYGVADAIVVADALHTLAFHVMLDGARAGHHLEALRRLADGTAAMISGQAQDSALDRRDHASVDDCLTMEGNKTGALLATALTMGAVCADGEPPLVAALERYGHELGLSFQAIDDLLGIWGDPAVTGKPVGSDLREHKKSLPVALALADGGTLAAELTDALSDDVTDAVVERVSRRLRDAGIEQRVVDLAHARFDNALAALTTVPLAAASTAQLTEVANFVVDRSH